MKKDIHPQMRETNVVCACGNTFTVKSTMEKLPLESCNKCHPFYTGESNNKFNKAGRSERFKQKYNITE
ncbi:MAG: 50S ribosomal protein L31 [Bacilli bacterium]